MQCCGVQPTGKGNNTFREKVAKKRTEFSISTPKVCAAFLLLVMRQQHTRKTQPPFFIFNFQKRLTPPPHSKSVFYLSDDLVKEGSDFVLQ